MLPFVVGGGILFGAVAIFKQKCSICDSYFTLNEPCFICGSEVCNDCGRNLGGMGRCCETKHGNIDAVLSCVRKVRIYSINYKGRVASPRLSRLIETAYYRNKDDAEQALKFITVINGSDLVQSVTFNKDTGSNGNYKFSIWKGTGVI